VAACGFSPLLSFRDALDGRVSSGVMTLKDNPIQSTT
jgi:hypothetical protein